MSIAILGSCGQLGRTVLDGLYLAGRRVHAVDGRYARSPYQDSHLYAFDQLNVLNLDQAGNHLKLHGVTTLVNALGTGMAPHDERQQETVALLTHAAIHVATDNCVPALINISSAAVYGNAPTPFKEDGPLLPISPYGVAKLEAEALLDGVARNMGVRVFTLRLFSPTGVYQHTNSLVWQAIGAAYGKMNAVSLYGINQRAYTNSADFARLCMYIDDHYDRWAPGHYIFNFGVEIPISQFEVMRRIEVLGSTTVPYVVANRDPYTMPRSVPDMSHTNTYLGRFISDDSTNDGLRNAILYFKACINDLK